MSDVVLMQFRCNTCNKVFFSYVIASINKRYVEDKALEITYSIMQIHTDYGIYEGEIYTKKQLDNTLAHNNQMIFNKPIENERICKKCRNIQQNDKLLFPNGVLYEH